ncbi:MAG: hypothetical protein ACKVP3_02070 [Hyphomicrobiaceae bacterium]
MFPFDLQAKLAQTWFDAAASGFAAMGALTTPPRNPYPWLAPAATLPASFWGMPSLASNPWAAWMTGSSRGWWQMPMPFYASWSGPLGFGMGGAGWPSAYRAWAGLFQPPTAFSMFAPSPWQPQATITLPFTPAEAAANTMALIEASYRTAGGHATAAIFRAMDPRAGQMRALSWTPMPFSAPAL